jgi:16S rRNA (cytidine1402-2'-O)-methyltransferase
MPENAIEPALYLIATPIGNLGDVTFRAVDVIRSVNRLYAEDTRHSRRLLQEYDIERSAIPCHEHNESAMATEIVRAIENGESCGLISDAGTPGISDPGFRAVRACRAAGLPVIPIPGANAAVAALSVSGLPTDQFLFLGFLPPKSAARLRTFESVIDLQATLIFYESTHRIDKFMKDAESVFGPDRFVTVARELTKRHETITSGPMHTVRSTIASASSKGEFVVLIAKSGYTL